MAIWLWVRGTFAKCAFNGKKNKQEKKIEGEKKWEKKLLLRLYSQGLIVHNKRIFIDNILDFQLQSHTYARRIQVYSIVHTNMNWKPSYQVRIVAMQTVSCDRNFLNLIKHTEHFSLFFLLTHAFVTHKLR